MNNFTLRELSEHQIYEKYYSSEGLLIIKKHKRESVLSDQKYDFLRDRIEDLERKTSPYFERDKLNALPNGTVPLKVPMYHYISQIKAGIFTQDNYEVDLKPQDDDPETIKKVESLNLILKTELIKARANRYIKEAILTSRKTFFGATLITWKNPAQHGQDDISSLSPFEINNIPPKALRWDYNYDTIAKMNYIYILSETTWDEIRQHSVLGKNKALLNAIENDRVKMLEDETKEVSFSQNSNDTDIRNNAADKGDSGNSLADTLILKTKFWIKNKNQKDQKCMVSYFVEDFLLANEEAGTKILPIAMLYEFKAPGDFYGTNTIYNLSPLITNYETLLQNEYNQALKNFSRVIFVSKDLKIVSSELEEKMLTQSVVIQQVSKIPPTQAVLDVEGKSINNEALIFLQDQERLIYQLAGIDKIVQGETGSLQTQSGVAGVLQESRTLDESALGYLQDYVERFNAIALEYIIKKYNGIKKEAKIRVAKPAGGLDEQGIDYKFIKVPKGNFNDLKVDILPSFDISNSINRTQSLSTIMQLITQDAQRPAGSKLFPDSMAILEALKPFLPNYRWLKLALARANSTKWVDAGQAAVQLTMNGLVNGKEPGEIGEEIGEGLNTLGQGGDLGEIPVEEGQPQSPEGGGLPPGLGGGGLPPGLGGGAGGGLPPGLGGGLPQEGQGGLPPGSGEEPL